MQLLKIGGRQLDDPLFLRRLAQLVANFPHPPVLVHGGGKGTSSLSSRLGLKAQFVDGLRVTDDATLEAAVMGLAGLAKMQMVQALVAQGIRALGLTGADAGLVRCRKLDHEQDLGWVGEPVAVDSEGLLRLLQGGWVPCISPLCLDDEGLLYNVNADPVAATIAAALHCDTLIFLTEVSGVLREGRVIGQLGRLQFHELLEQGHLTEGILPKLRASFAALDLGVEQVLITNLEGVSAWLQGQSAGTLVRNVI